jgi:hypothetical protein
MTPLGQSSSIAIENNDTSCPSALSVRYRTNPEAARRKKKRIMLLAIQELACGALAP